MDRLLEIDETSRLARVQAGVYGPRLEEQLNARGWTFGHYPDSFTHSTLGGWIATRSSGMQSDRYGDIADSTRGLRVVTPAGLLNIRPGAEHVDRAERARDGARQRGAARDHLRGDDPRAARCRSERTILGYLFPSWAASVAAMRDIAASEAAPSVTRVADAEETAFSFATKKASTLLDKVQSKALAALPHASARASTSSRCASASSATRARSGIVAAQRKAVGRIVSHHGGICIGSSPGELYDQKKFDTPYIRDYLLDRGVLADVSETAAPWGALPALHANASPPRPAAPSRSSASGAT